jgi:hypothetical protein
VTRTSRRRGLAESRPCRVTLGMDGWSSFARHQWRSGLLDTDVLTAGLLEYETKVCSGEGIFRAVCDMVWWFAK